MAGSFQVSPINISVPHDRPIGAVTVRNDAAEPVSIRVATYRWTQRDGEDVYEPTDDLIASPPIFTLDSEASQLVRVGLKARPGLGEAAYRVILEEIPAASDPSTGIRIALRLNLPLFKTPKAEGRSAIQWSARRAGDGAIALEAANAGSVHEQVTRIDWLDSNGKRAPLVERPATVLAGSSRRWLLDHAPLAAGGTIKLVLVKPGGEEEADAAVLDDKLPMVVTLGGEDEHAALVLDES